MEIRMQANDVRVLKGAAVPTALAGLVAVVIAAISAGSKGALGAAIGIALVGVFFTVGLVVVSWAGRISPMMMMTAAVLGYVVKVLAIMAMLTAFQGATAFDPRVFAITVIACTLVWTAGEMRGFMKLKMLYVEPGAEVPGRGER
jgi:ATP synthase protein I